MHGQTKEGKIQENRYEFPYHYIPVVDDEAFSQSRTLKWGYEYLSYIFFVLRRIKGLDFNSLLDIGCGDGRFLYELEKTFPIKRLAGLDSSRRAIGFAGVMCPQIEWVCGDVGDTKTLEGKFDIITLIETLEHIPPDDIEGFLKGIHYYLREGGQLVLTVPTKNVKVNPKHYQHFDVVSLKALLDPFFSVAEWFFIHKKSFFVKQVFERILVNRIFILNEEHLLRAAYRIYEKYFLPAAENNAKRIVVMCKKIEDARGRQLHHNGPCE